MRGGLVGFTGSGGSSLRFSSLSAQKTIARSPLLGRSGIMSTTVSRCLSAVSLARLKCNPHHEKEINTCRVEVSQASSP